MTRKVLVVVAGAAAIVALAVLVRDRGSPQQQQLAEIGESAPTLVGSSVRGGEVDLGRLRGRVVLLSFLDLRADSSENERSRAQIVFLRSMQTQHARFGLRVILVDVAEAAGKARRSRSELVNDTYAWNLDPAIAVLGDDGTLARRFGVDQAPTTFLIGPDGLVRKRWNGFAPAAQLDLSIRPLEGRSATD